MAKRYSSVDLVPLVEFIFSQLQSGHTFDLVLLSELLHRMAGSESRENIPERVLLSQTGGPLLRASIGSASAPVSVATTGSISDKNRALRRTSQRLLGALSASGLAIRLWFCLAQACVWAVQETDVPHLKMLGLLADQCHDVFLQYSEFITAHAVEAGLALGDLPSLADLISVHNVEPDYASFIHRTWQTIHTGKSGLQLLMAESPADDASDPALTLLCTRAFWSLELADLVVPVALYEEELARLKTLVATPEPSPLLNEAEKIKWHREKDQAPGLLSDLECELRARQASAATARNWLCTHRADFFHPEAGRSEMITRLLHHCLLPRSIFSPLDALYSARFLATLHAIGVPTLSSLSCYDKLIDIVGGHIFSLTEREAHCFGRFLGELLGQLHAWHANKDVYDAEAIGEGRPGFYQRWVRTDVAMMEVDGVEEEAAAAEEPEEGAIEADPTQVEPSSPSSAAQFTGEPLGHEDYRHVLFKWHLKLHRAFLHALESGDYQLIRNTIILLSRLPPHFPALRKIGASLEKAVARVQVAEEGKREDLRLLATRCLAVLQSRKAHWLPEDRFHHVEGKALTPTPQSPTRSDATAGSKRAPEEAAEVLEGRVKKLKIGDQHPAKEEKKSAEEVERELRRKLEERKRALEEAKVTGTPIAAAPPKPSPKETRREPRARDERASTDRSGRNDSRGGREQRIDPPREQRSEPPRDRRPEQPPREQRGDERDAPRRDDRRTDSRRSDRPEYRRR